MARKVVLATGIEGNGDWRLPDIDLSCVPAAWYARMNWAFDVAEHCGERIAVLGAGASALDTAAALLEAGATEVSQFMRRAEIPNVNPARWMKAAFGNYRLRKGTTWSAVRMDGDEIVVDASDGTSGRYDFLVLGTGYAIDVRLRPELQAFAERIMLWQDCFEPPEGEENPVVALFPYLNTDLSFREREPGAAPFLANIYNFTYSATASVGYSGASLTGMKYGIQRMLSGIVRDFWLAESDTALATVQAYADIDLDTTPLDPHAALQPVRAS